MTQLMRRIKCNFAFLIGKKVEEKKKKKKVEKKQLKISEVKP